MHFKSRVVKVAPKAGLHEHHYQEEKTEERGLSGSVRFFVDHLIGVAVSAVARKQAQTSRVAITCASGQVLQVLVTTTGEDETFRFLAYSNDMCLFVGSSPSLYVVEQTPRQIEHSIYLYLSERLAGEKRIAAQIFRESSSLFVLPVLEGSSDEGLNSLKPRAAVVSA